MILVTPLSTNALPFFEKGKIYCVIALTWFSSLCSLLQGLVSDSCLCIRSVPKSGEARCKVYNEVWLCVVTYSASCWRKTSCVSNKIGCGFVCACVKWSYFALGPNVRARSVCLSWFPRSSRNNKISVVNSVEGPGIKCYIILKTLDLRKRI